MNSIKISIIVPCYGVEKFLNRCVNTLVGQTLDDIEIILVDDKSPDMVPQICDSWSLKDDRIKVIHKEKNEGLGFARNTGLLYAQGEYIAFVDSDDYVEKNMYEILYKIASRNNADAVFCGFEKEYGKGKFSRISEHSTYTEFSGESLKAIIPDFIASPPYCRSEYKYDMSVWHAVYKRSIIVENAISFLSERDCASEDIPFQLDFLRYSEKIVFLPDILYHYCWNGGSLTKKISKEKFKKIKNLYHILNQKAISYDENKFRTKRLFIGYIRTFIRTLVNTNISKEEKIFMINDILSDEIWNEIKSYKESFLPLHQRIFSHLLYSKRISLVYAYAKLMEFIK